MVNYHVAAPFGRKYVFWNLFLPHRSESQIQVFGCEKCRGRSPHKHQQKDDGLFDFVYRG